MSRKKSGVNYSKTPPVQARRRNVIYRLQNQLLSGVKSKKVEGVDTTVNLSDRDIKRINKEILILKERV